MELDALQNHVAARIGQHQLVASVAVSGTVTGNRKRRHSGRDRPVGAVGVAGLRGEESVDFGDDESEITRASLIDSRIVDLDKDHVTEREPHSAACYHRSADAAFRARGPARGDARRADCGTTYV